MRPRLPLLVAAMVGAIGMSGAAAGRPLAFTDLPGWAAERHEEALGVYRRSCAHLLGAGLEARAGLLATEALRAACAEALALPAATGRAEARAFFERRFRPVAPAAPGLMTGYYEPEVEGSRTPSPDFPAPLYARPADLVSFGPSGDPALPGFAAGRRRADGTLEAYPDRAAIEDGALRGRNLELLWLPSAFDVFIVQVQGSARIRLPEGEVERVAYAGRNGHPYTSIGRRLIDWGVLTADAASLDGIRAAFAADPALARRAMRENRSFVFFRLLENHDAARGPIGAQGVPLTPGRSIAVDRSVHAYGTPFYVMAAGAGGDGGDLNRLAIAQDTGTAIVGPARVDWFVGWGDEAGRIAGRMRHPVTLVRLEPVPVPP